MKRHRIVGSFFLLVGMIAGCAEGPITSIEEAGPRTGTTAISAPKPADLLDHASCRVVRQLEDRSFQQKDFEIDLHVQSGQTGRRHRLGIREWAADREEPVRIALCEVAEPSDAVALFLQSRLGFSRGIKLVPYRGAGYAETPNAESKRLLRESGKSDKRVESSKLAWATEYATVYDQTAQTKLGAVSVDCQFATDRLAGEDRQLADSDPSCCEIDPSQCAGWSAAEFWEGQTPPMAEADEQWVSPTPVFIPGEQPSLICYAQLHDLHVTGTFGFFGRLNVHAETMCNRAAVLETSIMLRRQKCFFWHCWWGLPETVDSEIELKAANVWGADAHSSHSCAVKWFRADAHHYAVSIAYLPLYVGHTWFEEYWGVCP